MKKRVLVMTLAALSPLVVSDTALADPENLPGVEPVLFENIDASRKDWEGAQERYMESMTTAMKRLREEISKRTERLVKEDLESGEREDIYREIKALEERHQHLDDEENMLQAATIVKWANRKEEIQQFFSSSKRAITGATGLTDGI